MDCRILPAHVKDLDRDIRTLAGDVYALNKDQASRQAEINDNFKNMTGQLQNILLEISGMKQNYVSLQEQFCLKCNENDQLKVKIRALEHDLQNVKQQSQPRKPSLLIGSSIIKDIESNDESKLKIKCLPGSKFDHITDALRSIEQTKDRYETVTIVAGGNNCSDTSQSAKDITEAATSVVKQAQKIAKNVTLSSILPRHDTGPTELKVENVNPELRKLCEQNSQVSYVNNDGSFRLADGSPNDAFFLQDKTHLTYKGTERLIKNLTIPALVRRRTRQYRPKQDYNRNNERQFQPMLEHTTFSIPQPIHSPMLFMMERQNPVKTVD
jgi:regulator of replication initiation timing